MFAVALLPSVARAANDAPATDTPLATVQPFYDWDESKWHDAVFYVMGAALRDHLFSRRFAALVAADERCQLRRRSRK